MHGRGAPVHPGAGCPVRRVVLPAAAAVQGLIVDLALPVARPAGTRPIAQRNRSRGRAQPVRIRTSTAAPPTRPPMVASLAPIDRSSA